MQQIRVGVDTGGTFTDFIVIRRGVIEVFKEFSTPARPEEAILRGMGRIAGGAELEVIHGSTVATNALLERKGARTALLTTAGFEDVLVIGRQTRRELYNISVTRPLPLVADDLRLGVKERVLHDATVEKGIDMGQLKAIVDRLQKGGVESVAVCLLFSFANPKHEETIAEALRPLGIPVSLSSKTMPEYREYERTSTTVINAYLAPKMSEYLNRLSDRIQSKSLRVMQSNGGAVAARTASEFPVRTIVSGPAGGVVGAFHVASKAGYSNIITFDMGGTSTDVALCRDGIQVTHEGQIDGLPVGIPMIDIHTVGAGGGSIAELDMGGALRVGPESAGADPGPICYGRGERLTVTDANVILGRLPARFFLGGTVPLATERIAPAVQAMPWSKGWKSIQELAQGVIDIVNNNMEQAVRLISVERGHDPADFALVCFGGAGGLHAADLARALGIPRVVVPRFPGALSALWLLLADARKDYSRSVLMPVESSQGRIREVLDELHRVGEREMKSEGFASRAIRHVDVLDMRYRGQSYELSIPMTRGFIEQFHRAHHHRYGYSTPDKPVEIVNVRTSFIGRSAKPQFRPLPKVRGNVKPIDVAMVWIKGKRTKTSIYDRESLGYGHIVRGPAIIGEYSSTTLVPADFVCKVDAYLNLMLERDARRSGGLA
jgi:N-methylhydantoinase A